MASHTQLLLNTLIAVSCLPYRMASVYHISTTEWGIAFANRLNFEFTNPQNHKKQLNWTMIPLTFPLAIPIHYLGNISQYDELRIDIRDATDTMSIYFDVGLSGGDFDMSVAVTGSSLEWKGRVFGAGNVACLGNRIDRQLAFEDREIICAQCSTCHRQLTRPFNYSKCGKSETVPCNPCHHHHVEADVLVFLFLPLSVFLFCITLVSSFWLHACTEKRKAVIVSDTHSAFTDTVSEGELTAEPPSISTMSKDSATDYSKWSNRESTRAFTDDGSIKENLAQRDGSTEYTQRSSRDLTEAFKDDDSIKELFMQEYHTARSPEKIQKARVYAKKPMVQPKSSVKNREISYMRASVLEQADRLQRRGKH